ncbi:MAG: leucine-rich repeat protein, partial [Treponema sp.]|nr:leucine-rich repeat protein [Treponema sp.]
SVTSIENGAFNINQLTSVTIGNSVTTIGIQAFYKNQLTSLTIGNGVTTIGEAAFANNQLISLTFTPTSKLTTIGNWAFYNSRLSALTIPPSVTAIGNEAFNGNQLTSVTLGANVALGTNALGNAALASAYTDGDRRAGSYPPAKAVVRTSGTSGDFTYSATPTAVTITGYSKSGGNVVIPARINNIPVTTIGNRAFRNSQLTGVTIPQGVITIGEEAFENNQLFSITIPDSVTSIGINVFRGNPLFSVTLGANVVLGDTTLAYGTLYALTYNRAGKQAGTYPQSAPTSAIHGTGNRTIVIDMFNVGDYGWMGSGFLRISVNGTVRYGLADNVRVADDSAPNTAEWLIHNQFKFRANTGDRIEIRCASGTDWNRNSFIVYEEGAPLSSAMAYKTFSSFVETTPMTVWNFTVGGVRVGAGNGTATTPIPPEARYFTVASNGFWCPITTAWSIFIDDGNGKAYSMGFDSPQPVPGQRFDISTMTLRMGDVVKVTGGTYFLYPDGRRQILNHNFAYEKAAASFAPVTRGEPRYFTVYSSFKCPIYGHWQINLEDGSGAFYSLGNTGTGNYYEAVGKTLRSGDAVKLTGGSYQSNTAILSGQSPTASGWMINGIVTVEKAAASLAPRAAQVRADPDAANWNIALLDTAANADYLSAIEKDVILEQNKARSDPQKYARLYIQPMLQYFGGNVYSAPGQMARTTQEGAAAVNDCIAALNRAAAVGILRPERGLSLAAKDHVADQGGTGERGHNGSDNSTPTIRMSRYGVFTGQMTGGGENIAYGPTTGRDIVVDLLVDDGVPDRGHRTNMLNNVYTQTGTGFGPHTWYGRSCTINYATGYRSN